MAIADHKQVKALLPAHVWCQCVRILVNFVGVARLVPTGRRKRKLRNRIETLVTLSSICRLLVFCNRLLWLFILRAGAIAFRCLIMIRRMLVLLT